jgi:hypothetical protein
VLDTAGGSARPCRNTPTGIPSMQCSSATCSQLWDVCQCLLAQETRRTDAHAGGGGRPGPSAAALLSTETPRVTNNSEEVDR